MTDLDTVASVAEIVGAVTVLGAAVFASLQIREFRRQRRDTAALSFLQNLQAPETFWASRFIATLPEGVSKAEVAAMGPDAERAINRVYTTFETLGYMVHRRMVPLHLADEMAGGTARLAFRKLRRYIEQERREFGPNAFEWFQWLVERMEEDPAPGKAEGAHLTRRDWRP